MNLFSIPEWAAPLIVFFFFIVFTSKNLNLQSKFTSLSLCLIFFDQFNFALIGSLFDPIKIIALAMLPLALAERFKHLTKVSIAYLLILIIRDVASLITQDTSLGDLRFSLQLYVTQFGIIYLATIMSQLGTTNQSTVMLIRTADYIIAISLALCSYQFVAHLYGLPINGIRNLYTESMGGEVRWAGYTLGGVSLFRPYALFGEPKFLGAVIVSIYSFSLFLFSIDRISLNKLIAHGVGAFALIILTASVSAAASLICITLYYMLFMQFNKTKTYAVLSIILIGAVVSNYIPFEEIYNDRYLKRVEIVGGVMEPHEEFYLDDWISHPLSLIFGNGYSYFSQFMPDGFRLIPNIGIIWLGSSGGAILIMAFVFLIIRRIKFSLQLGIFCISPFIYSTNSSLLLTLIFSAIAYRILNEKHMRAKK
ncbi:hypothetical protein [Hydrogenophaga sp.]|uniref:hypothetical protein n=1 Tax=Hydrogenophaga sp. TaxID=1904254 RepID=UPI0035B2FEF4